MSGPRLTPETCPACKRRLRVTAPVFAEALARVRCPLPDCGAEQYARITTSDVSLLDPEEAEHAMHLRHDPNLPWQGTSRLMHTLGTTVTLGMVSGLGLIVGALLFGLLDLLAIALRDAMPARPTLIALALLAGVADLAFFIKVHAALSRRALRRRLTTVPLVALAWEAEPEEHQGYRG